MEAFAIYDCFSIYFKIGYLKDKVVSLKIISKEEYYTQLNSDSKNAFTDSVYTQLFEYLKGNRKNFTFECLLIGTKFQKKVWNALLKIPYGKTATYKEVAVMIGNPKACRAVGGANNKNPIAVVYPCHRVIGSNGKLTGYAGGLEMKDFLLKLERENVQDKIE